MKTTALLFALTSAVLAQDVAADAPKPAAPARIAITVTKKGFEPGEITVPAGKPVTLVFTRKTDQTCAKEIVMTVDGKQVEHKLPLDKPVEIVATFPKAGKLGYACAMDMIKGTIVVQ